MQLQVSDAELDIMKIIWSHEGPVLFSCIMEELAVRGSTWQKNTVITLLSRLMSKGLLQARKTGRRNEYTALLSEEAYQTAQTRSFLTRVYEGNVKGLVANLIENDLLSEEEYQELQQLLDEGGQPHERNL